ncbi:MAG: hypothetical protein HDR01_16115 [Lachnospiraceae bacterium]|nr:hypothetical protein [Lachnospiraceae bacterium]
MRKKFIILCMLAAMFVLLTGCAGQKDGETTILVEPINSGANLQATLQVNTKSGKEWSYFIEEGILTEISAKHYEGFFVANKKDTYVFEADDTGKEMFYCILMAPDDYDNAKVYEYTLTIDNSAKISIDSKRDYLLSENSKLMKKVKGE